MELRLGLRARATRDVDAMLRRPAEPEAIEQAVREALAAPLLDGAVTLDVRGARPVGPTGAVRFDVRVLWRGRALAKVTLEVSSAEGESGRSWDALLRSASPPSSASRAVRTRFPACRCASRWPRNSTPSATLARRTIDSGTWPIS